MANPTVSETIERDVAEILATKWVRRDGVVVPEAENVQLGNDGVCVAGAVLYADMADSTGLVKGYKDWFAAEVIKAYLSSACRVIRANRGVVTSFDGDRVMGVFIGANRCNDAARSALMINYAVLKIINPRIKGQYPETGYQMQQSVGIDGGDLFVARSGVRGANDLVWIGRAANYAAKLCSLREGGYASYLTEAVWSMMDDSTRLGGEPKRPMWEKVMWSQEGIPVYKSNWHWKPA